MNPTKVYLETGKKKTFAAGLEWPGWCRAGRDEHQALQALIDYGPRYAQVLNSREIDFQLPSDTSQLIVFERHAGNSTTDFGAPAIIPAADREKFSWEAFELSQTLLQACWGAFDIAVQAASGRELGKGPRGGGRDVEMILVHVLEADQAYLNRITWKHKLDRGEGAAAQLSRIRQAIIKALEVAANGELPERGPRGGIIWPPRYFIRRSAWHVLDHAWEIEDRIV